MSRRAERIIARARRLVGIRFRPQGRDAATGLDCIGLAAAALRVEAPPAGYALRGGALTTLEDGLRAAGLRPVGEARAGDLLALAAGAGQLHLAIFTGEGIVHADAGLRRIVERPGPAPWPVLGVWRMRSGKGGARPLHQPSAGHEQVQTSPGRSQPCRGHGVPAHPRSGEE